MSVDYGPQKAHEYYEKNKQLKGRTSTKGFTKSQKEQFAYAKSQLNEQKKAELKTASEKSKLLKQRQRQDFTNQCSDKVKALREKLANMSKEQKEQMKDLIKNQISSIKAEFKDKKTDASSTISENAKSEKTEIKDKYQSKLEEAHKKIKG